MSEFLGPLYTIDRTVSAYLTLITSLLTMKPYVFGAHYPLYPTQSFLNRVVIKFAKHVHVHSKNLLKIYQGYVSKPDRLSILTNALQVDKYNLHLNGYSKQVKEELGIPHDSIIVLLAGRLSPFKGQDDLIRAASIICKNYPNIYFIIAGHDTNEGIFTHGPLANSFKAILQNQINELNLNERVILAGYYPDLVRLMANADIATMPSWEEPFGLVALEAMLMGKPVIASNAGGVPEFINDGETGLLIPPKDPNSLSNAILKLVNNPDLRKSLGQKAQDYVLRNHNNNLYIEKLEEIFQNVK